jgi:hypothetical protein
LQHYRADCVKELKKSCAEFRQNSIKDTNIWNFKENLITRTADTLRNLGFFGSRDVWADTKSEKLHEFRETETIKIKLLFGEN